MGVLLGCDGKEQKGKGGAVEKEFHSGVTYVLY